MQNPLLKTIECQFLQVKINNAKLISESYHFQSFGDATAIYELDNIKLKFTRDRGQDLLDICGSEIRPHYYAFSVVSLAMEWQSLNEIINVTNPIDLHTALHYIKNNFDKLKKAFAGSNILVTEEKLKNAQKIITQAMWN